ncbi:hypothetical protein POM88_043237 [Heracleum sosnowskyi]|uniref:NAC domain-containing protein n=1 Tax=Heracleum sosnowskyi TaxID=360622 RepID=A0AAD8H217_9APIA|nr:hypothetical protein POM88_043237 [Heracleum sosnowskyi]
MAMANDVGKPPGFRFKPSDDELITFYLKPKILKQHLSYNIMDEVDLYASDSTPWLLFDIENTDSWDDEKSLYVFTSLSKVSCDPNFVATKSRINNNKKAGCGTWVQKTSPVPIKDCAGNVIGGRRMLVFNVSEIGDGFDDTKAVYFKMHEYSLWGVNEGLTCDGRDVVLCKISFDVSKKSPFKLITEKSSDDHVSKSGKIAEKTKKSKKKIQSKKNVGESKALNTSEVVEESKGLNSESIDGRVGYAAALNATVPYEIDLDVLDEFCGEVNFDGMGGEGMCFDDLNGEEMCFDMDEIMQYLNSPEEELLDDDTTICSLGKRKSIEGNNLCQAKKVCL